MISKRSFKNNVLWTSLFIFSFLLLNLVSFGGHSNLAVAGKSADIECYKEAAKTIVHGTAVGLGEILKDIKKGEDRIRFIRTFISKIRFYPDQSGYFYAYDFNCVNIAHATQPDLVGKNLYDHQDVKGKYVIRELSAAAIKGGGFVEFYWLKPGFKTEFKKMGYVEPIPGTTWFIGTGVYLP